MITAPPLDQIRARHTSRASLFQPKRTYTLLPDRLLVESDGGSRDEYPLSAIRGVNLRYFRSRYREYWYCDIDTAQGRLHIRSKHWASVTDVQDHGFTYVRFIRQLLRQLRDVAGVQLTAGSWLEVALVGVPLLLLGFGVVTAAARENPILAVALAGAMVAGLAYALRWMLPRAVDADAPPLALLPTEFR